LADASVPSLGDDSGSEANGEANMPGAMEASTGGAPEIVAHSAQAMGAGEELSPEEKAVHIEGVDEDADEAREDYSDEDADTAALAEGRLSPPTSTSDEGR
jgi:hypothetical protein